MSIYDVNGNILHDDGLDPSYTDAECVTGFMAEVNKKAASIGMTGSNFKKPAGDSNATQTTAHDMALLTVIAAGYRELAEVWSKDSYTIVPRNRNTSITVSTTVHDATLEADYPILGGKTGGYLSAYALACICDVNGKQVAGYIGGASSAAARFSAMKQLMDICADVLAGNANTDTVTDATYAAAFEMPTYSGFSYEKNAGCLNSLYTQADTTALIPASTAKIITCITMLDWVPDITATFRFESGDMIGGSGGVFSVGDVISYRDALYALMLPSSNMTAHAVARVIGRKILSYGS